MNPNPLEVFLRRVEYAASHEPVYMRGVSEEAAIRIADFLRLAENAGPEEFELGGANQGSPGSRRNLRMLCALIPAVVPDSKLAEAVHDLLGSPYITVPEVSSILRLDGADDKTNEHPGTVIRKVGLLLREEGLSQTQIAREVGVRQDMVSTIAQFLGSRQAKDEALREMALRFLERGESAPHVFQAETGVTLVRATQLLAEVKTGLERVS